MEMHTRYILSNTSRHVSHAKQIQFIILWTNPLPTEDARQLQLAFWLQKSDNKEYWVNLMSVQSLLKINLAYRKSYLLIICPNSYKTLAKSKIRLS